MSFPTVYYITQVIPPCYTAGYAMCVCVSFSACVYRSLESILQWYGSCSHGAELSSLVVLGPPIVLIQGGGIPESQRPSIPLSPANCSV